MVMGTMIVLTQLGIYGGLALVASRSRDFLVTRPGTTRFVGRAAGYLFLGVAASWCRRADCLARLESDLAIFLGATGTMRSTLRRSDRWLPMILIFHVTAD
jgi:hypothetical protein